MTAILILSVGMEIDLFGALSERALPKIFAINACRTAKIGRAVTARPPSAHRVNLVFFEASQAGGNITPSAGYLDSGNGFQGANA